jgi:hypothetical protein
MLENDTLNSYQRYPIVRGGVHFTRGAICTAPHPGRTAA